MSAAVYGLISNNPGLHKKRRSPAFLCRRALHSRRFFTPAAGRSIPDNPGLHKKYRHAGASLQASFTIEAAFIIPVSIFLMVTVILLSFYLHDSAVMSSTGVTAILSGYDKNSTVSDIMSSMEASLEDTLIMTNDVSVRASEDDGEYTLHAGGSFNTQFAFASSFLGSDTLSADCEVNISHLDGRSELLKYKLIRDGVNILSGDNASEND